MAHRSFVCRIALALGLGLTACKSHMTPSPAPDGASGASGASGEGEGEGAGASAGQGMGAREPAPHDHEAHGSDSAPTRSVTVTAKGQSPRSPLFYGFAPQRASRVVMKIRSVSQNVDGGASSEPPTIVATLRLDTLERGANGRTPFAFKVEKAQLVVGPKASVPAVFKDQVRMTEKALEQLHGQFAISPTGEMADVSLRIESPLLAELGQLVTLLMQGLEMLFPPLPNDSVGEGAEWRVRTSGGSLPGALVATHTMASMSGKTLTLRIEAERQDGPGAPAAPGGSPSGGAKGTYDVVARLDGPALKAKGRGDSIQILGEEGESPKTLRFTVTHEIESSDLDEGPAQKMGTVSKEKPAKP